MNDLDNYDNKLLESQDKLNSKYTVSTINPILLTKSSTKKQNKKYKKIKAYCSDCYQFFHNSPYSKICQKHIKKECNIISCQKNIMNKCIRKFSNKNSANRHTYCITKEDVEQLDKNLDIKRCLGQKRKKEEESFNTYDNVHELIEQINHVNFNDDESNFMFNYEPPKTELVFNFISNEETIENLFESVQRNSNITNTTKKKLIRAFKNKGIHNVRVLKLFIDKYNGWDCLVNQFKDITPQIEGISLCIEDLLKN